MPTDDEPDASERLSAMFDQCDDDYLKFERIPEADRLHSDRFLCACLKIHALLEDGKDFETAAEHDILYLAGVDELKTLTQEDVLYLTRCGIHFNEECDCLARFT